MAKVKIQGHASGTGILTVTAPNTSTDRTITLPDATGTLLNSDGDGSSLTGANANRPNAKPLIINGSMAVSQRATSVTGLTNGSDVYVALDRFGFNEFGSPSSQHTMTQESLTSGNAYINGFANALKMDVTTAQSSLDADDSTMIIHKFEGQDLQLFKKGTANAEKFTLAFWVKSTKTGTHICELFDKDNTRTCSQSYTVSSTDTWEHKVVNFPADTTGIFGDDNARSLDINWFLSAGTNYTSGTLQTSWGGQDDTARAVGQVNTVDSTSNNWHITGIQLEVGEYSSTTIPPFQHESYGDNLAACQRYCQKWGGGRQYASIASGLCGNTTDTTIALQFPVVMRANPTIVIETIGDWLIAAEAGYTFTTMLNYLDTWGGTLNTQGGSGMTAGTGCLLRAQTTGSHIFFTAEL